MEDKLKERWEKHKASKIKPKEQEQDKAFSNMEKITELESNEEKQQVWLKNYDGLNCMSCIGSIPEDYNNCVIPYQHSKFIKEVNLIRRKKSRLCIEFDNKNMKGEINKDACKIAIEKVKLKLDIKNHGYIISSHGGSSPYLWVEFTRDITKHEAEQYLTMICSKGDNIDFNFAQDDTILPVLFAEHWKYPGKVEELIEFKGGSKVDFDKFEAALKVRIAQHIQKKVDESEEFNKLINGEAIDNGKGNKK